MHKLFLLAEMAGSKVAICSDVIESVVTVNDVIAVPRSDPIILGLFALRSRVLTLIDCQYAVSGVSETNVAGALAAIASIGGHSFGLVVSKVFDVVSVPEEKIQPALKLGAGWKTIVSQFVDINDQLVMIIDPERLVATDIDRVAA